MLRFMALRHSIPAKTREQNRHFATVLEHVESSGPMARAQSFLVNVIGKRIQAIDLNEKRIVLKLSAEPTIQETEAIELLKHAGYAVEIVQ